MRNCQPTSSKNQVRRNLFFSRSNFIHALALGLMGTISFAGGCSNNAGPAANGSGTVAPVSSPQQDTEGERPNLIATEIRQKLIGAWLGQAAIDRDRLNQVLATLPEDRRREVERLASEFLTTNAALAFDDSGSFEQEIEVVPASGEPLQAGGFGRWSALETDLMRDQILVEAKMELTDGSRISDQLRFQFASDGQMSQLVELGEELAVCRPTIVFQKQVVPAANIAEGTKIELK